jgi:catechol 2,3-dioxygenase-like lactoylglutathione lyase family enzyme
MKQEIVHIALVVRDSDEAIDFYVNKLNFELIENTYQPERENGWVVVAPPSGKDTTLLLARTVQTGTGAIRRQPDRWTGVPLSQQRRFLAQLQ